MSIRLATLIRLCGSHSIQSLGYVLTPSEAGPVPGERAELGTLPDTQRAKRLRQLFVVCASLRAPVARMAKGATGSSGSRRADRHSREESFGRPPGPSLLSGRC
jgi:hypothetical protein